MHYLTSLNKFDDPGALEGRTSPAPSVTIKGDADLLPSGGLAFDAAGDLWVATGVALFQYTEPLALSGDVNPAPRIALSLNGPAAPSTYSHLLFFPPPQPR